MKKFLFIIFLNFMVLMTPILVACDKSDNDNKLVSLDMLTSQLVETKTTYYVGDSFSPSLTYVNLTYYDKDENTEWTLKDYSLTKLSNTIADIKYEIKGFDSSASTNNQTIKIVISSETYPGEVSTNLTIQILPEYVVNAEVINSSNHLKECFSLNETLNYENFKIQNTYSNGRTEIIDVTSDMIEGFNTSIASTKKKTLKITQNNFTISHDYIVTPSDNYILFDESFVKCFVPSTTYGFNPSQPEQNVFKYYKTSLASISLGYYSKFSYTQSAIINLYNTGSTYNPNVSILSYEKQNINDINITICKFKYDNSSIVRTGIYFDRSLTVPNGSGTTTFNATIEILYIDYANNAESLEIYNTLLNSLTK